MKKTYFFLLAFCLLSLGASAQRVKPSKIRTTATAVAGHATTSALRNNNVNPNRYPPIPGGYNSPIGPKPILGVGTGIKPLVIDNEGLHRLQEATQLLTQASNAHSLATNVAPYTFSHKLSDGQEITIYRLRTDAFVFGTDDLKGDVTIPDSVTLGKQTYAVLGVMQRAFASCENLTTLHLPSNIRLIDHDAFADCRSLTSVNLPEAITSIESGVFSGCTSLATIDIPANVKIIGQRFNIDGTPVKGFTDPFRECTSLKTLNCYAATPPELNSTTLSNPAIEIHVPQGCAEAYRQAEQWKDLTIVDDL